MLSAVKQAPRSVEDAASHPRPAAPRRSRSAVIAAASPAPPIPETDRVFSVFPRGGAVEGGCLAQRRKGGGLYDAGEEGNRSATQKQGGKGQIPGREKVIDRK